MRNQIEYKLYGPYALFTDPITRVGGEKCTMQTPTYQALKGITESIYWKPTITWYIDEVRVMKPIRTESKNMRPINFGIAGVSGEKKTGNTLSIYTYLRDVEYHVRVHFEFNLNRPEMKGDRDENKHHNIARRMVERGGRRDIFLGTRECQGYVEPCPFDEGKGFYDDYGELAMGFQFHGFNYPDETGSESLGVRLWNAKMENGIIRFPRPEQFKDGDKQYPMRTVREGVKPKLFVRGKNMSFLEDDLELLGLCGEENAT